MNTIESQQIHGVKTIVIKIVESVSYIALNLGIGMKSWEIFENVSFPLFTEAKQRGLGRSTVYGRFYRFTEDLRTLMATKGLATSGWASLLINIKELQKLPTNTKEIILFI